ncbi:MAG TPA: serine/threonine-protein kinase [Nannocystaceae bacterium]|nr:serine/threonine-protein kinase [Nannocystaceae bacterium]
MPTALQSVRALPPGLVLGRYVVVERIGAGGMAELYLARVDGPPRFAKAVALKLLHPHMADDPELVRMLEKEARIAATLDHPGIVQVIDVDTASAERFVVLEYVHGRDLRKVIAQGGALPLGAALRVVVDIARALHFVHGKKDAGGRALGLVHRDVSPSNVLVSFEGAVKLADFGIAKISEQTVQTSTGTLKGKFGYMSPEQYLQEPVDAKTDVFALGIVLYEASTGRRAFFGEKTVTIMNRVLAGDYIAPGEIVAGYPEELAQIVADALAIDPCARTPSTAVLADAVEAFAARAGIDMRTEVLATHMRSVFGDLPAPTLDVPATRVTGATAITRTEDTTRVTTHRRSRTGLAAALVLAGIGVGSLAGWGIAKNATPEPTVAPEREEIVAPVIAPATIAAPVVVDDTPSVAAPVVTAAPQQEREPQRSRARTSKRRNDERRKPAPAPSAIEPRAGMFPKGMQ